MRSCLVSLDATGDGGEGERVSMVSVEGGVGSGRGGWGSGEDSGGMLSVIDCCLYYLNVFWE